MVRPKRVGLVNIKVTARSSQAGDGIERLLKVEPEGEPQFENMAILIDLRDKSKFDGNFSISIPKNAVADSTKIEISAIGKYFCIEISLTFNHNRKNCYYSRRFVRRNSKKYRKVNSQAARMW